MTYTDYDAWKLATPSYLVECEACGEWVEDFEEVAAEGQTFGAVLCRDCAREVQRELDAERLDALRYLEEEIN